MCTFAVYFNLESWFFTRDRNIVLWKYDFKRYQCWLIYLLIQLPPTCASVNQLYKRISLIYQDRVRLYYTLLGWQRVLTVISVIMKKMKRFNLGNARVLSPNDITALLGGEFLSYTCSREGQSCAIQVDGGVNTGTCKWYYAGETQMNLTCVLN